ncbi:unnamed protein product [Mucor circinelloides]|uniref:Uncharacterized protein n=1 Tax=Mucor circinelloides f. circinelloides (strain 1006PhL) TaxID=1220926 RepID=S2KA49_MUCC1|nr:hypothetical protein HMPREF1544_00872 [Mucor circinelloides 1006PhL]
MMDQTQILDPNYYVAASTVSANIIPTASTSTHIPFDQYQQQQPQASHHPQAYIYSDPQQQQLQQQQQQQQYPTIDFFYETPHIQPTPSSSHTYTTATATNTINTIIPTASTSYQNPMTTKPLDSNSAAGAATTATSSSVSGVDEDYVQNLANELQHTKQLLSQYQIRTEQLMELVKKQTDKISELREQLANKK